MLTFLTPIANLQLLKKTEEMSEEVSSRGGILQVIGVMLSEGRKGGTRPEGMGSIGVLQGRTKKKKRKKAS